jgi:anti-sigma factor RsiW
MPEPVFPDDATRADLIAYLDGELDEQAAGQFEARLGRDPALRAEADALKRTWDLLDYLPRPEPSADFASRTLTKVPGLRPTAVPSTSASSWPVATRPAGRWTRVALGVAAALLLVLAGYGGSGLLLDPAATPRPTDPTDEELARDVRLLENLHLYRHADDLNFLHGLDEMFGDEAAGL